MTTTTRPSLLLLLVLTFAPAAWAQPAPIGGLGGQQTGDALATPGPYGVRVGDLAWVDAARQGRRIDVRIYEPVGLRAGSPLVVFSHGLGGDHTGYAYIGEHLASHGLTAVHLNHPGSDSVVRQQGYLALVRAGMDLQNRLDRPKDVSFVLDEVRRTQRAEPLLDQVDLTKIAVAGHSFGAYTALAVVGQTFVEAGQTYSFRDRRVRCAVAMSPQGPGTIGLTEESWDGVRAPVHTMTGTEDTGLGTDDVADRRAAFDAMPPGDKHHLTIEGAEHSAFGDRFDKDRDPRHHGWILAATTGFLRATLLDDRAAAQWLERGQLQRDTRGEVVQERR